MFLFQVPVIPEMIWKAGLDRLWPGYLKHHEQVADARFSASQKSDGLYGVKLYRANFLTRLLRPRTRVARCPVQVIIPTRDAYVRPQLNEHLVRWTGKLTLQTLDTTHWAPLTEPEAVSRAVPHIRWLHTPELPHTTKKAAGSSGLSGQGGNRF